MVKKLRYVFDRKDKMKLVGLAILMIIGKRSGASGSCSI